MSEVKIVLAFLLRNFRFQSQDHRDKILVSMEMVLRPKVPLKVAIFRRNTVSPVEEITGSSSSFAIDSCEEN